jgi:hypothetical protein
MFSLADFKKHAVPNSEVNSGGIGSKQSPSDTSTDTEGVVLHYRLVTI